MSEPQAPDPAPTAPMDGETDAADSRPSGLGAIFGPTINAVVAPAKAFDTLAARPALSGWILLWVTAALIGLTLLNLDIQRQFMRVGIISSMQQRGDIDTEQLAQTIKQMDRFAPITAVAQSLFLVILVLVVAAVIWGGSTVMGGRAKFSRALSVAAVGAVIHPLLVTAFVAFNWRINPPEVRRITDIADAMPTLGLDLLIGSDQMSFGLRMFLMRVDLFNIWWVVLVIMGSERLLGLKRGAAVSLAVGIWLAFAVIGALFASIGS